jgi:hypothetical protein
LEDIGIELLLTMKRYNETGAGDISAGFTFTALHTTASTYTHQFMRVCAATTHGYTASTSWIAHEVSVQLL